MVLSAVAGGIGSGKLQTQRLARDLFGHLCQRRTVQHAPVLAPDAMDADQPFVPAGDDLSKIPSPVMTRSALANAASKPARSNTHSAPPVNSAFAKNTSPAPSPPAAPPIGIVPSSGRPASAHSSARRDRPAASCGISSGRAPF